MQLVQRQVVAASCAVAHWAALNAIGAPEMALSAICAAMLACAYCALSIYAGGVIGNLRGGRAIKAVLLVAALPCSAAAATILFDYRPKSEEAILLYLGISSPLAAWVANGWVKVLIDSHGESSPIGDSAFFARYPPRDIGDTWPAALVYVFLFVGPILLMP